MSLSKVLLRHLKKICGITSQDLETLSTESNRLRANPESTELYPNLIKLGGSHQALLEAYSDSLKSTEERLDFVHRAMSLSSNELTEANQQIRLLMDSLGQGVLIFGPNGLCHPSYSSICEDLLECTPGNIHIADVLKIPEHDRQSFNDWIKLVFSDDFEFREMMALAPRFFKHSHNRNIKLEYREARTTAGTLSGVILIATDKTGEEKVQRELKKQKDYVDRVVKILHHRSQFQNYFDYLRTTLEWLKSLSDADFASSGNLEQIKRALHNLKGTTGSFHLNELLDIIHQSENLLATYVESQNPTHLKEFKFYLSEMEIYVRMFLLEYEFILGRDFTTKGRITEVNWEDLRSVYKSLISNDVPNEVREKFLKNLMSKKISDCLAYLNSALQIAAERTGKRCFPIIFEGGDLLVIEDSYKELFSTFVHFASNAARHGIESPSDRETLGKPLSGQMRIACTIESSEGQQWLKIEFKDDGQGISAKAVRDRLKAMGRPAPKTTPDEEVIQVIFEPDFSTAKKVDLIAGRGVGLNAIYESAIQMGGQVTVTSERGKGTTFTVCVPYLWDLDTAQRAQQTKAA